MAVLVVGGGIGGLVAALSLHQVGVKVKLFERVLHARPLEVGIVLSPNAVRELDDLGFSGLLAEIGIPLSSVAYHNRLGQRILSEPSGIEGGYRWPQYAVPRDVLQTALVAETRRRIGRDNVHLGCELLSFDNGADRISAAFRDKSQNGEAIRFEGSLLIGADGIASTVRRSLNPQEGEPIWNGAILWRGMSRGIDLLNRETIAVAGNDGQKFVCYPLAGPDPDVPTVSWIAQLRFRSEHEWREEEWNRPGQPIDFLPAFEDWRFDWLDVPKLVAAAKGIYEFPMIDRDPLRGWSKNRATLLGDAAHPMHPVGTHGASEAIIDARIVARSVALAGETAAALTDYETARRLTTKRITLANRQNGPEQILQIADERAPDGFSAIEEVARRGELLEMIAKYRQMAGIDADTVNNREALVPEALRVARVTS